MQAQTLERKKREEQAKQRRRRFSTFQISSKLLLVNWYWSKIMSEMCKGVMISLYPYGLAVTTSRLEFVETLGACVFFPGSEYAEKPVMFVCK